MQKQYQISDLGFLPNECHKSLPKKFLFMQDLLDNLSENKIKNIRTIVHSLPNYDPVLHSIEELTMGEKQFMYSVLSMATNRYIWCTGVDSACNNAVLPAIIGMPWKLLAEDLGISPALTHAAVDLWNWKLKDENKQFSLDNIDVLYSMTGENHEAWFYKVMISIEGIGGSILKDIELVHNAILNNKKNKVAEFMINLDECLLKSIYLIKRMREHCDPDFFFNKLRIYLGSSDNPNLPDGVRIEGDTKKTVLRYKGGSAAQSTLIQVFDALLGVIHTGKKKIYLDEMLQYMPKDHRNFLLYVRENVCLKSYVTNSNNSELLQLYNECVTKLTAFRESHYGLICSYINKFVPSLAELDAQIKASKYNLNESESESDNESDSNNENTNENNAHGAKGSGGTNPVLFCRGIILDTEKSVVAIKNKYQLLPTIGLTLFVLGCCYYIWRR
jgi:indoleamine 2,3-dioxygenase